MRRPVRGVGALVTGASRGIGAAIAVELARAGARVALVARSEPELAAVARAAGEGAIAMPADLRAVAGGGAAAAAELLSAAARRVGPIGVLVNNAGIGLYARVEEIEADALRRVLELNVVAPHLLARAALPGMRARGQGAIVNISSVLGRRSIPMAGGYCASKHALEALSESLRAEVADAGVRVLVVRPGRTESAFQRDAEAPMGWRPPPMRAMAAEQVARRTVRALERGASQLSFTAAGRAMMALQRASPRLTDAVMRRVARRLARPS